MSHDAYPSTFHSLTLSPIPLRNKAKLSPIPSCNSTGVYGGVLGAGNGDSSDLSNLDSTFLRGLTPTDASGVAQFTSIFPGHYAGRATHMHVVAHLNGSTLPNSTYVGGQIAHIGQLLFDQALIDEIEALEPYSGNTITVKPECG